MHTATILTSPWGNKKPVFIVSLAASINENGHAMNNISADNYFCIIPEWVLYSDITATAVRLYGTLQRYADKETGACHPSRATLAAKCNCTVKSIDRALSELITIGAVRKKQRISANGDMTSNQYTVITVQQVASEMSLPSDKKAPTGGDKNDIQTIVNLIQSQERTVAQSIAHQWWQAYKERTGGKTPTGKGAWHSLLAIVNGALKAGWSEEQVTAALMACSVPSSAMLDIQLNKSLAPVVALPPASKRRLPIITGDASCDVCSGAGVVNVFNDETQQWQSKKCSCYQERF